MISLAAVGRSRPSAGTRRPISSARESTSTSPESEPSDAPAVRLEAVTKVYPKGEVRALDGLTLDVERGTFLAVMGRSGSGKSTLLHCAAGLDVPTGGSVQVGGAQISSMSETERTTFRRDRVGFVFQSYNLIPSLSVEQNITLPSRLAGTSPDQDWLSILVERLGLADLLRRHPGELSGGQQQRVTIARALTTRPEVVFADEPTGALDLATGEQILNLLADLVTEFGQSVVMVTHDPAAASWAQQTVVMADGRIECVLTDPDAAALAAVLSAGGK